MVLLLGVKACGEIEFLMNLPAPAFRLLPTNLGPYAPSLRFSSPSFGKPLRHRGKNLENLNLIHISSPITKDLVLKMEYSKIGQPHKCFEWGSPQGCSRFDFCWGIFWGKSSRATLTKKQNTKYPSTTAQITTFVIVFDMWGDRGFDEPSRSAVPV